MLPRRYKHRKSRDLDLFVTDAQSVRWCSPRFNETAADLFPDYDEEAAAVKLVTGMQEIDYRGRNFQARDVFDLACVAIAEPEEIAAVLSGLTSGHLDDLDARLKEMEQPGAQLRSPICGCWLRNPALMLPAASPTI